MNPDRAYPVLLNLLPPELKGLSFAALTAAVVASLAGKSNSIATVFTVDIYKRVSGKHASERQIVIAPFLGVDKKGGFQYIQEYTGFVSPGIFAMFILGFFWKRTTSNAALFATIGGFVLSVWLKFSSYWVNWSFLEPVGFSKRNTLEVFEIPFLDWMSIVFVLCVIGMWSIKGGIGAGVYMRRGWRWTTSLLV